MPRGVKPPNGECNKWVCVTDSVDSNEYNVSSTSITCKSYRKLVRLQLVHDECGDYVCFEKGCGKAVDPKWMCWKCMWTSDATS